MDLPSSKLQALAVFLMTVVHCVYGHGRLWEPPGRSTMWMRGYSTPVNVNDNELNCGTLPHQVRLGYKCGICGDPYDGERKNEEGGVYATGLIGRTYQQGQRVTIQVEITANHLGYFEFKICPKARSSQQTTQQCLDQNILYLSDGSGSKFRLTNFSTSMYYVNVNLPGGLTCEYCVLQWRYHTGNSWGVDPDGTGCLGCGFQEEFYGCADIRIVPSQGTIKIQTSTTAVPLVSISTVNTVPAVNCTVNTVPAVNCTVNTIPAVNCTVDTVPEVNCTVDTVPEVNCTVNTVPAVNCTVNTVPAVNCTVASTYSNVPGIHDWCVQNCPGMFCSTSYCICS